MALRLLPLPDRTATNGVMALTTERGDGDFSNVPGSGSTRLPELQPAELQPAESPPPEFPPPEFPPPEFPWVWVDQVHGANVLAVTHENRQEVLGSEADAMVTGEHGIVLALRTGDCIPIVMHDGSGVFAVVHAGWRGLLAGVVTRTAEKMRTMGATAVYLEAGPCIGPECYRFGEADLRLMATRFGDDVRANTSSGEPSLDLRAALVSAASEASLTVGNLTNSCTSCDAERWFSYRARRDAGRMATLAWREHDVGRSGAVS